MSNTETDQQNELAKELEKLRENKDIDEEELLDSLELELVTRSLFESERDVNTLKTYLKKVTGEDVALANFTPAQINALQKIMSIDKMYLEPSDKIPEEKNNCKQITKIAVKLSKSKRGFGVENLRDMLHKKPRIESEPDSPENLGTKGGKKENEPNN